MTFGDFAYLAGIALVLIPLERCFPLHAGRKHLRPGWCIDLLHVFVSGFLIRVGAGAAIIAVSVVCAATVPSVVRDTIRGQHVGIQFVELLVLSDLGFYVAHRLFHAVPALWRFHEIHHSSEQLDWLATFRVHPVDQIVNAAIIAVPGIALGFSPGALAVYGLVYRAHSMLLHSNVKLNLGWLQGIVACPTYHHWHHAEEREAYDKNFGGQLVIWDRLFGTFYHPSRLPHRYGVKSEIPRDYVEQILGPFSRRGGRPSRLAPRVGSESGVS